MMKREQRTMIEGTAALNINNLPEKAPAVIIAFPGKPAVRTEHRGRHAAAPINARQRLAERIGGFDTVQALRFGTVAGLGYNNFTKPQIAVTAIIGAILAGGALFLGM